ncbi:MAG: hypothetical protein MUC81_09060 [Bacteroidia bacterium]|jgi:hypothetical protein|nr:hypothetical protein [Bacteroidia bacterium]
MKKIIWAFLFLSNVLLAQQDSTKASAKKIILIPYAPMMYFSDADQDISRFSKLSEQRVRHVIRTKTESHVYHKLLSSFDVVSLVNATSLNGEEDLKKIYAATQYYVSTAIQSKKRFGSGLFKKKDKKQQIYTSDSSTMVAEIASPPLLTELAKKHQADYFVYITQFEINTSNKNSIEWLKQDYKRTYILHYNVWGVDGKLLLAETITIEASGENTISDIETKYLALFGEKLKEILVTSLPK